MPGRAALIFVALTCLLLLPQAAADDAELEEVPIVAGEEATSPAPSAPPQPRATPRTCDCPPVVKLRRVPVYADVEVPVFERRRAPRYREIMVPVFKNRCIPVYATRCVPVFEDACTLVLDPPFLPRFRTVRRVAGWRHERVLRGERCERVPCGVRPHRIRDGFVEETVETGTRTERRLVGWRCEPCLDGSPRGLRVGEGVLTPCSR